MNAQATLTILQLILAAGNLVIMIYALSKFLAKPHDSLSQRVTVLEVKVNEHDLALKKGNDRFKEQDSANEVLLTSLLALIEFEIQYLLTEDKPISRDLEKAKDKLHAYLAKR